MIKKKESMLSWHMICVSGLLCQEPWCLVDTGMFFTNLSLGKSDMRLHKQIVDRGYYSPLDYRDIKGPLN